MTVLNPIEVISRRDIFGTNEPVSLAKSGEWPCFLRPYSYLYLHGRPCPCLSRCYIFVSSMKICLNAGCVRFLRFHLSYHADSLQATGLFTLGWTRHPARFAHWVFTPAFMLNWLWDILAQLGMWPSFRRPQGSNSWAAPQWAFCTKILRSFPLGLVTPERQQACWVGFNHVWRTNWDSQKFLLHTLKNGRLAADGEICS